MICPRSGPTGRSTPTCAPISGDHAPPAITIAPHDRSDPPADTDPGPTRDADASTMVRPRATASRRTAALNTRPSTRHADGLHSARATGPNAGKRSRASDGSISDTPPRAVADASSVSNASTSQSASATDSKPQRP